THPVPATAPNCPLNFLISVLAASSSPFPSAPFALASLAQPSVTCCTSGFQLSISLLEMLLMLLAGRRTHFGFCIGENASDLAGQRNAAVRIDHLAYATSTGS